MEKTLEQVQQTQKKTQKKLTRRTRKRAQERSYKRWSPQENQIYALFLLRNLDDFNSQWNRRSTKVYLRLSRLIKTKNINQCKSHHQKMISYCGNLGEVIKKFLGNPPIDCGYPIQPTTVKHDDVNSDYVKMQSKQFYMRQIRSALNMYPFPPVGLIESHPIYHQRGECIKTQNAQTQHQHAQMIRHPFPYPYPLFSNLLSMAMMPLQKQEVPNNLKEQEGVPNILKLKIDERSRL